MESRTKQRVIAATVAVAVFGAVGLPRGAWAALNGPSLALLAAQQRAQQQALQRRIDYYSAHYGAESGPFDVKETAVGVASNTLFEYMHWWSAGDTEYGVVFCQDPYGQFWFTEPKPGNTSSSGYEVNQSSDDIRRPGCQMTGSMHTHPFDPDNLIIFPDPGGDNLSGFEMWVQRFGRQDGTGSDIWYFRPNAHNPKLYGATKNNGSAPTTFSKYIGHFDQLPANIDLYHLSSAMPGTSMDSQTWLAIGGGAALTTIVIVGIIFGGGGGSTTYGGDEYGRSGTCSGPSC